MKIDVGKSLKCVCKVAADAAKDKYVYGRCQCKDENDHIITIQKMVIERED